MARKLASIVEIGQLLPIEGADKIEVAIPKGKGWKVVVGKGDFKIGELAVFFEIDSFLNPDDERYAFLKERCLRKFVSKSGQVLRQGIKIKSIKLRGVISQGLLMPIDRFPEITGRIHDGKFLSLTEVEYDEQYHREIAEAASRNEPPWAWNYNKDEHLVDVVGADVTKVLHVEHYDEVKEMLQPSMGNPISADAMGKFPELLGPKSDEERLQNLGDWFETKKGRLFQISCKHDGTSCTVAYSPMVDEVNPNIVCSRNLRLKRETEKGSIPVYWQMAEKYDILGKLKSVYEETGKEYMIQGEVVGPGIQKTRNKEMEHKFLCFRMWDVKSQMFVNPVETVAFCKKHNIPHVQIVKEAFPFFDEITTMDEALRFAEGKTAEGNEREGIVCKSVDDGPYCSFKVVSNRYLLSDKD